MAIVIRTTLTMTCFLKETTATNYRNRYNERFPDAIRSNKLDHKRRCRSLHTSHLLETGMTPEFQFLTKKINNNLKLFRKNR